MAFASKSSFQLSALALALASIGAQATTINWATDTSGLWSIPGNWSPVGLPGVNDDVLITNVTGLKTITHGTGNDTIRSLTTNASAIVLVNGGSSLSINSGASTNGGTMRADGSGSALTYNNGSLVNNGTLNAINNAVIGLNNVVVSGGTLSTSSGGTITLGNGTVLDGSSNGAMTTSGQLVQNDNVNLYAKGTINNSGDIRLGANSDLHVQNGSDLTLAGNGTLTLAAGNTRVFGDVSTATLTNAIGHTIQGVGQLGVNQLNIVNRGTITANVSGGTLSVDPTDSPGLTNTGVLRAENGGTLNLAGGAYKNVGGTVSALTNSTVSLSGATLQGGTLATAGTGQIVATGSAYLDGASQGAIANTGKLVTAENSTVYASGTINNTGTISVGVNSDLRLQGGNNLTLSGAGSVTLAAGNSRIFGDTSSDILTNASGHTIQGQGQIGINQLGLVNQGLITANVSGGVVTIDTNDALGTVNTGTLRAENGGQLNLVTAFVNNSGATIEARAGSLVLATNSVVLQGGTLTSTGTGAIHLEGSAVLDGQTRGTINNTASNLSISENQTVYALGTINNTTNLGVGVNADLRAQGTNNLVFAGNGTVSLTSGSSRIFGDQSADLITNTSGHTIQGVGQIGINSAFIANQGLITANVSGQVLQIDPTDGANGVLNTGTLRADNGGQLNLLNGTYNNQNGTIEARNGSIVYVSGAAVQGGVLNATTGNAIQFVNSSLIDGATRGAVTSTGNLQITDNQTVYAAGTINNAGTLTVGTNADLRMQGTNNLTLAGSGTLNLASSSSRIFGDNGADVLTNSATHTIQGQGQIGVNSSYLVNRGLIVANLSNGITIDPTDGANGVVNTGTIRADGGTISIINGTVNNAGGLLEARNGSTVATSNATLQGGTFATSGGGTFQLSNSSTLDGTTNGTIANTGRLLIADNQTDYALGTINNTGAMSVGANADLRVKGTSNLSLTGAGTLTLLADNARIFGDNSANMLINGVGHTIDGRGQIGVNSLQVTNAGTIAANVNGAAMTLLTSTPIANQSTGTLLASNGGALNLQSAVNGTGTIRSDSGGTVIVGQASTTGQLVNNANLSLGANNLTVSGDYSNANFGTGNAFNKRANVSGTGLVLSSGSTTAQAITGATVGNGTTSSPTLTIGNVRVGGTTYNYQVANGDANGPALRGAIQTSVNGGNITDARLSGSGVTAGNYGPVAGGANSGNLGVTFTASSAGTLAPLSGQAVHIANNFSNVGEQTLNIVLGSGAAAYNAAVGNTTPSPATVANQRVGGTASTALTVSNTAAAGNFSEALNASISGSTGAASGMGSVGNIAAGSANTGALSVGVNTTTSGAKSGTVTVAYQTDGTGSNGHSGLSAIGAGSQTINVSGNVYQTAAGNIVTAPLNFGTVQVGQNVSQVLTVQNTATGASGFVEDLNASFGTATGTGASRLTGSGSINGLAAGSSSNGLTVGVNTSSAGTVNASIAVNYFSAGTVGGVSNGLGTLAVGSQGYGVSGTIASTANVVDQAAPVINNSPVALGNVRIGSTSPTGTVSVTNQATGNQQAALNASISGNGGITAAGSFNLLAPGATNNTSLRVGLDTNTAGNKSGNATIGFVSDASNIGGCGSNCQMSLGSQNVAVTGAVYRLANPNATPSTITVAGRVGSASPTTAITVTNASPDIYTEGLTVTRGATSSGFTATGGITNLAAGGTSNAIGVTLNTATAGTFSGSQALNYVSTGAGTTGAADLAIGSGSVTLNGRVYTTAAATNNTPSVNFGIVHVGDTASRAVSVTNSAPVTALNDTLVASAAGATGPFTASGSISGLAAGSTSTALSVGLNTATAGVYSGSAAFSAASHDADLSDAALANLAVSLAGQVNNYASDAFALTGGSGSFSHVGSTYILDYGTVAQNSGTRSTTLTAANTATGPADLLAGNFQFLDPADFGETGFAAFMALAAGQSTGPLTLSFSSMTVGSFVDTIVLHGVGSNASGYSGAIGDIQLVVRGIVSGAVVPPINGVPEPDSLILLGLGIPLLFLRRGRKSAKTTH